MFMPNRVWSNKRGINLRSCAPLRETKQPVFEYLTQRRKEHTTVGAPPHSPPPRSPPRRSSIHHRRTRKPPHPRHREHTPAAHRIGRVLEQLEFDQFARHLAVVVKDRKSDV